MNYKIIDNFLEKNDFLKIKDLMLSSFFAWYYIPFVSNLKNKDGFYFTHNFYSKYNIKSESINILEPIIDKLNPVSIIRIKGNFYPKTKEIEEHEKHVDFNFSNKGFIFYVNTNNGFTRLKDGSKIESIENRGLFFDAGIEHNSSTCSDQQARVNINFNFF
jgi:hypothetical protein